MTQERVHTEILDTFRTFRDQIGINVRGRRGGLDFDESTILFTGATGGIGIHVLHSLVRRKAATTIICPIRASSDQQARSRLDNTLHRHLLPSLAELESTGITIRCVALDSLRDGWFDTLPRRPIGILHFAWPVNFKRPLSSFSDTFSDLVALLNFALETQSPVYFASSVGAYFRSSSSVIPAGITSDPGEAVISGYGKSKWVADQLFDHASKVYGLRGGIFRIGQICGDTKHGIWNEREAIPLMIHAASVLGVIPERYTDGDDRVSWMPVDQLAEGMVAATLAPKEERLAVWNFVNPHVTPWRRITDALQRHLPGDVAVVPYDEWISTLRRHRHDTSIPAIKLLDWYSWGLFPTPKYDTASVNRVLAQDREQGLGTWAFTEINEGMVGRMVKAWTRSGFLRASSRSAMHRAKL